ncbi:hypothetical protein [Enterobacter cloacae]
MSKINKMNTEQAPYKLLLVLTIKCCACFTVALYLALLGVSIYHGLKIGVFKFDFYDEFIFSLKKGLFFGVIYGLGDWVIRKAKNSEKNN